MEESRGKELLLWLLRRRQRFRVRGESMFPLLKAGDEVLVDLNAFRSYAPAIGDLVVARHPQQPDLHIIKRVREIEADVCQLAGDNLHPTKSSSYQVPVDLVLGRVTSRFAVEA